MYVKYINKYILESKLSLPCLCVGSILIFVPGVLCASLQHSIMPPLPFGPRRRRQELQKSGHLAFLVGSGDNLRSSRLCGKCF